MNNNPNELFDAQEVQENKVMGILCYFSILWLIPFFSTKDSGSEYMKFHLNQGVWTLILTVISCIIVRIPYIGGVIGGILGLITLVVFVLGMINATSGKKQKLPVLGDIVFFK